MTRIGLARRPSEVPGIAALLPLGRWAYVSGVSTLTSALERTSFPEEVALAIAGDEYPALRPARYRRWLDRHGVELKRRCGERGGLERAHALCDYVRNEMGFRGSDDYDDPRGNYLNDVIDRRTGSPVAMAVLLMALGHRAEIVVHGVAFPGHFLVRIEGHYADPFEGAAPIARERLIDLARETLEHPEHASASLEPVGLRTIAVRLLLNLQRIHALRADHARALVVCDRLFELTRAPHHRVDRAVHALALGATRTALSDLEAYLAAHPQGEFAERAREHLERARQCELTPMN